MTKQEMNRLIAEKCEGWTFEIKGMLDEQAVEAGYGRPPQPAQYGIMTHPDYFTDIAACVRAAEAWRKQKHGRSYELRSGLTDDFGVRAPHAVCFHSASRIAGTGESLAAALVGAIK